MPNTIKRKPVGTISNRKRVIYAIASVIVLVIIVLVGIQLSFIFHFNNQVKEYLQTELTKQTKGEYKLTIEKLSTNLFNQSVCLLNVTLVADRKINPDAPKYFVSAEKIELVDFKVFSYLFKKDLFFDKIKFVRLSGKIYRSNKTVEMKPGSGVKFSPYKLISKHLHSLAIGNIEIRNADINFYDEADDSLPVIKSRDNVIKISNLRINNEANNNGRWFLADTIGVTINKFDYRTKSKIYTVRVKKLVASSTDSTLTLDSIQMIPNYNKHDFGYKAGKQTDRISILVDKMRFEKMSIKLFFERNSFIAKTVNVDRFILEAYRDKNIKGYSKKAKSIQQLIKSIPFYIKVDEIHIKNSQVTYDEVPKGAESPGVISFNKINGTLTGLTNDRNLITGKSFLVLDANCQLMNEGYMLAHYDFPLETDSMVFDCSAKLTNFPLTAINPTLEPLAYLSMKEGTVDTLIFNFHATNTGSKGKMELRYHGLKVSLLKNDNKKKIIVIDFFALNLKRFLAAILVKKSNPTRERDVRVTEISFPYDTNKFIFHYTWKSILSGIKPAIGIPSKTKKIKESPPK